MSDAELEARVVAALRREVPIDPQARRRIMERVREAARGTPRSPRSRRPRLAHGARHSLAGLAMAAGLGSIVALSSLPPAGDTLGRDAVSGVIGDTVLSSLRDTLRLVRLILHDSAATRVAVVGDFNGWRTGATPLVRDAGSSRWSATLAARDGMLRYVFVVDGTRWVPDPSAQHVRADDGRVYSLLHVTRVVN